jgi:hypothetical protein
MTRANCISLHTGLFPIVIVISIAMHGCEKNRHMVLAATGTNIGIEISQNPGTQQPQAKLGYQRTELAVVPTNRSTENSTKDNSMGNGALDVADVIMELRYGGIFDWGPTSNIYQRLAVGKTAVVQPGANLMFAKGPEGKVSKEAEEVLKSLGSIKPLSAEARGQLKCLSQTRQADATKKTVIDAAVKKITADKMSTLDEFTDSKPADETIELLRTELKKQAFTDCTI